MSNQHPTQPADGLAEPEQKRIEERALEIANADGRDAMSELDLSAAREEILGRDASTEPTEEALVPGADEDGQEQMPS